ncbi:MAG: hypothetical protein WC841_01450 [Candidatus Shapirobacteria bacterium]|jgi:hypothetical protein
MTKIRGILLYRFLTVSLIIGLYLATRFQNLTFIPVFGDEAIYLRWSQIIKNVETLRFIPQTDGKQPLFMWITVIFFKFIKDPLAAGRTLSVLSGFGTMIILFVTYSIIENYHSNNTHPLKFIFESINNHFFVSLIPCIIYIFLPFSFFFDRMALPDNLLSFFGILSLFLSLLLSKFRRLDLALLLGFALGLSWLTKSPAIYFIVLSVLTYVFYLSKNTKTIILPVISVVLAFIIYNILRLGPQFHMIALRNKDYVWTLSEIIRHPLDPLVPHLWDVVHIFSLYISIPLFLIVFLFLQNKFKRDQLVVFFWFILPLIASAAMSKVFTARYILFTLPPLIILISRGAQSFVSNSRFKILTFLLLFTINLSTIYQLSYKPFYAKLPSTEQGYLSDWTSGWGINEAAIFLRERAKVSNVIVGTEGYFGTLPDGLQIYTQNTSQLTVFGVGLGFNFIPEKLIDAKNHGDEVYLLINKSRNNLHFMEMEKIKLIKSFPKPQNDSLDLYQIT